MFTTFILYLWLAPAIIVLLSILVPAIVDVIKSNPWGGTTIMMAFIVAVISFIPLVNIGVAYLALVSLFNKTTW